MSVGEPTVTLLVESRAPPESPGDGAASVGVVPKTKPAILAPTPNSEELNRSHTLGAGGFETDVGMVV